MTDTEKIQAEILAKLDVLTRLMAIEVLKNIKSKQQQVEILHAAGFSMDQIAELLNVKYSTVGVTLFHIRQAKAKKKAKQARQSRKSEN